MVYKFFDKKISGTGIKSENMSDQQLAEELHKQTIRKFKGTLMQIWKSPNMFVFIEKQYPENFTFVILLILELFGREICNFMKT